MHVSLLDHSHECFFGCPTRFKKARQVASLPQLRDLQRYPSGAGVPVPLAVSISLNLTRRRTHALCYASSGLNLRFHDPPGRESQHLAHEIAIGLLFNQLKQRHSVVGHRRLRSWFRVSQPEPSRRSTVTTSVTPGRALRYAKGFARGLLHQPLGHYRFRDELLNETCSRRSTRRGRRSRTGSTTTTTAARIPASGTSRRSSSWQRRGWKSVRRSPKNQPVDSPNGRRRVGVQVTVRNGLLR
ncbi:hypothetical protein JSE7799_02797 [Jannaschia seosinensis]|uniref:Uncharacterized protein n=1 Tax=Jannaschia seosinensis TaxID=313367 RepID=A0A0M7BDC4_9RHOB|nr:hypothetical protein JSE7799_02797 [Jannaschia seosinensis]